MKYEYEDIRTFFTKRSFLVGDGSTLTEGEYEKLKAREWHALTANRADYLRAFMDGWLAAKG